MSALEERGRARDVNQGVSLRPVEMRLVERAREYLSSGAATSVALIGHVCQLPSPPSFVAEHMAVALLGSFPEFVREGDGSWRHVTPESEAAIVARALADHSRASTPLARTSPRLLDMSFSVVDVETTGGRSMYDDRIIEIAAVRVSGGAVREVYETLVNPERAIPPIISRLTNISWPMVRDKPRFRDIAHRVADAIRGHVFVAHNVAFDWRFVSSEIERATGDRLHGRRLCTVRLARRLLPQLRRRSLDYVARHYGVEISGRHRAGGDAIATAHVLVALLHDAADSGCETWDALERLLVEGAVRRGRRRRRPSAMPRPVQDDPTL